MESPRLCKHKGQCYVNAVKGFLKSAAQGLIVKSALHVLLNIIIRKGYRNPLIALQGLFSFDALRFTCFTGLMSFLFKSSLCTLRQLRQKDDGLNYLISGFISGLSIAIEDKDRRETWSLYFAARCVDMVLRSLSRKYGGWDVNKLEVYLFMLMIAFMVWSFGAEADNLPKSYYKFIHILVNPSKGERRIMDAWCKNSSIKHPLNL